MTYTGSHHFSADSVLTSVITAFVANEAMGFLKKIVAVLFLAMITEIGRQAIGAVASRIRGKKQ